MSFFDGVRPSSTVNSLLPAVQLQAFSDGRRQYYQLSGKPVAFSMQVTPLVIADYDGDGSVRGLEFLGGLSSPIEGYLLKALTSLHGLNTKNTGNSNQAILIGLLRSLHLPGA